MTNVVGSQMTIDGRVATPKRYISGTGVEELLDNDWIRSAFVLPDDGWTEEVDIKNRFWNTAQRKFTDGRWGCNIGVNAPAQFTAYADPPNKGRMAGRIDPSLTETTGNYGMGELYSDMYDDPAQIVYFRFGVPEFASFFDFFTKAFHHGNSIVARTGRFPLLYTISSFIGTWMMAVTFPFIVVPALIYKTLDFFFFRQSASFYHMKPTMHLYWGAVNTLVNTLALNSGVYPKILKMNTAEQRIGMPYTLDQETMSIYHELAPDIFSAQNYIDVFAVANRAQRLANRIIMDEFEELNNESNTNFYGYVNKDLLDDDRHRTRFTDEQGRTSFTDYVNKMLMFSEYFRSKEDGVAIAEQDPRNAKKENTDDPLYGDSAFERFAQHFDAEFRMGGQFATFRVEHTGSTSESFSNSTTPSDLENKFNSTSSDFMHKRFTIGNGAILGDILNTASSAIMDVGMGLIGAATIGIGDAIKGMLGDGYIDIPEHWQSSSSSLPRASYRMVLETPYGNTLSRIMNLFLPFAMVAAGAWPRSTGRKSYTAPFLCQVYDKGRVQIPLGMITEFTVTRGRGNIGYTADGKPLSMEVTWTVKDLSRVLHMPLMPVLGLSSPTMMDETSSITNYLAAVAGQSIENQIYPSTKAKIRGAKLLLQAGVVSSPAFWGSFIHDRGMNGTLVERGLGTLFEASVRNAEGTAGAVF